jgi:ribose-phosphate pyrophosphokinase
VLSGPAVDRLAASEVTEVAVTNTIAIPDDRKFDRLKILSVAPLFAKAIRFTHSDQSVSSLFG